MSYPPKRRVGAGFGLIGAGIRAGNSVEASEDIGKIVANFPKQ
jgi:hypothetical protein